MKPPKNWLDLSDEQLMRYLRDGQQEALRVLFERHTQPIFRYAKRLMGGNEAAAEEVTQQAWIRVVDAAPKYEEKGYFKAWIYKITHNLVLDQFRRESRFSDKEYDETDITGNLDKQGAEQDLEDVEETILRKIELSKLRSAIDELPDQERVVVLVWMNHRGSQKELAEELGITFRSLTSILFRVRKKLERLLEEEGSSSE